MQFNNLIEELLGQKSKVKILRHLVLNCIEDSGRRIAADTKMSPTKCHEALAELVDQGAVKVNVKGKMYLYSLNRGAYIVDAIIEPLFMKERDSISTVISDVSATIKKDTLSIVLFGSIAKREELPYSDIDILVIAKDGPAKRRIKKKLEDIAIDIHRKYRNELAPYVLTATEYLKRIKKKDSMLTDIEKSGRLVYGMTLTEITIRESKAA
ncbi:MAG: nucleotidyltransferase domain-containing protein [Actinomycetota bacterium]